MQRKWDASLGGFEGLPGDFWKFPKTCNFAELLQFMLLFAQSLIKIKARNEMMESSSPNLEILA